jgi:gliding motility-associated-like protein
MRIFSFVIILSCVLYSKCFPQSSCSGCSLSIDSSFTPVIMTGTGYPDSDSTYRNDDFSSLAIKLPFTFCFYGSQVDSLYINNNGNISFDMPYYTFTAEAFPSGNFSMVAPFWGDVDTRDLASGLVYYKLTPTSLIVVWDHVGYYNIYSDKVNTFKLIISDGTDPIIPDGNNTAFCYEDMQWTTGDASYGINGFGGYPATVGANKGDGINFIQFGQFDTTGKYYSGPYPQSAPFGGIDWLDKKVFIFSTCNYQNIPPILSGLGFCDTIRICKNDTLNLNLSFLSPENDQTITTTVNSASPGFSSSTDNFGSSADTRIRFIAGQNNIGYNYINVSATDNGTPAQTTSAILVVLVDTTVAPIPGIKGQNSFCLQGGSSIVLKDSSNYTSYSWNNGATTAKIFPSSSGDYICTVNYKGCLKESLPFSVTVSNSKVTITGNSIQCQGTDQTLSAYNPSYVSYLWNTGETTATIEASSGWYYVSATDNNGCESFSDSFYVDTYPYPAPTPVITGDQSLCPGETSSLSAYDTTYIYYSWNTGDFTSDIVAGNGSYSVTVMDINGCPGTSAVFNIQSFIVTKPIITGPGEICNSDDVSLNINNTPYISCVWNTGSTAWTIQAGVGEYWADVIDLNGCPVSTDTFEITYSLPPTADFIIAPDSGSVIFNPANFQNMSSGNSISFMWDFGDGTTSSQVSPDHAYENPGLYKICLTTFNTSENCSDTICKDHNVYILKVDAPNLFTPNGDNKNDFLVFRNLEFYHKNHLRVYNRWGSLIFDKQDYRNDWNAIKETDGIYYYQLDIPELLETKSGWVHILR